MNPFNNQYRGSDIKAYYRNFYQQNKPLVYLMAASLAMLIIGKANFLDILFYVYLVYFGGYIIKQYLGNQKVISLFLVSGFSGFAILAILFPQLAISVVGVEIFAASAALGLLAAAATYVPNMEVILVLVGKVKIKWIAIALIGIDMLHLLHGLTIEVAHLGGIAYGAASMYLLRRGNFHFNNPLKGTLKKKGPYYKKTKTSKKEQQKTRTESDEAYHQRKNKEQAEIDAILDKIKNKGYSSLSKEEKQKLFEKSNRG